MFTRGGRRFLGAAGGMLVVSALLLAVPSFACSPSAQITTTPARGAAGTMVEVNGKTFDPGVVRIWFDNTSGVPMAELRAAANGTFTQQVRIPANAQPGSHSIVATLRSERDGRFYTAPASFAVDGATATPSPPPQPAPVTDTSPAAPAPAGSSPPAAGSQPAPSPVAASGRAVPEATQPTGALAAQGQLGTAQGAFAQPGVGSGVPNVSGLSNGVLPPMDPLPPPVQSGLVQPTPGTGTDRSASTAQRTVEVGGPSPWWLLPLGALGATLLSLSAASFLHEIRQRRKAEVEA